MRSSILQIALAAVVAAGLLLPHVDARADFALHDGDTVVFLGDSNTDHGEFARIVETYSLLRFPERKIRFKNRGVGGDTAEGALARLESDVFREGANVVIVIFGANEIAWGWKPSEAAKRAYLAAVAEIVERCVEHGVAAYVSTYFSLRGNPYLEEKGFLHLMGLEGIAVAESAGGHGIDIGGRMFAAAKPIWDHNQENPDDAVELHLDRVHLGKLGHELAAFALLKELGAPSDVSSVSVNAADETAVATGALVRNVSWNPGSGVLRFERMDRGLPLALNILTWTNTRRWIPMDTALNGYRLAVTGLPEGSYDLKIDDQPLEPIASAELAQGLDIHSRSSARGRAYPGGPWRTESLAMKRLADARQSVDQARALLAFHLGAGARTTRLERESKQVEQRITKLQRLLAEPAWYAVELKRRAAPVSSALKDPN
ncbi:MAG: GDSL-type esterase/lipase family protein [Myxococcota bacterium]